jgi:glutamine amidotransferase
VESELTADAAALRSAEGVILPGVGAFEQAMSNLRQAGLVDVLREVADAGRPFIGICLGVQLLFTTSEEHGLHDGLNIIAGQVKRFGHGLTVPQMGWNQIRQERPCPLFEGIADQAFFYFAHSYYVDPKAPCVTVGSTEYGHEYTSMVQAGNVYGAQFHPEKSGPVGLKLLANFVALCGEKTGRAKPC